MTRSHRSLFDDIVLDDPGVCNNCYRRTHDVIDHWYPDRYVDTAREDMFINPRRYRRYESTDVVYLDGDSDDGPKTACKCGVLDGQSFERPLSMSKLIDYAHNIVDRLDDADLEFDRDRFYDEIRAQKSDPTVNRRDETIFRRAIDRSAAENVREYASRRLVEAK